MATGNTPLFRRAIVPWYDSDAVCYAIVASMALVLLFGIVGIVAAGEEPAYRGDTWVPVLLVVMSLGVIVSIIIRLVKRNLTRASGLMG